MAEGKGMESPVSQADKGIKSANLTNRAEEEKEGVILLSGKSPRHHKETHGTSDDIDQSTPIDEVKGPSVFHRVKEEIEAVVEAVLPRNSSFVL
ncbi:hypothetical protein Sango_0122800 [Sesamum angolense]|uniref:Uncharacterized protein n=1 Tax=Sesamum angolense TaxID=2727404 RepID=A0AAE1XEX9_9LAMI|nr:hypothetical protein Sango_0122800 [Sesamum angolense]